MLERLITIGAAGRHAAVLLVEQLIFFKKHTQPVGLDAAAFSLCPFFNMQRSVVFMFTPVRLIKKHFDVSL